MKKRWRDSVYVKAGMTAFIVIAVSVLFYLGLSNLKHVGDAFSTVMKVLMPFLIGIAIAYVLSPLFNLVERPLYRWLAGKGEKPRRHAKAASKAIASAAAVLVLLTVIAGLLLMVIPQMVDNITRLIDTMPEKTTQFMNWITWISTSLNNLFSSNPAIEEWVREGVETISDSLTRWMESMVSNLGAIVGSVTQGVISGVNVVVDIVIGLVICVYVLNSKDLFTAQCKKLVYSVFKINNANYIISSARFIHRTFGGFINGKIIDSLIIGVLCFIGLSILRIPYALLLSAIVGVFNLIPIFGPIIGAVIGTLLLLLENPLKALFFLIFVIVLQQIDGNVIGPKILGQTTGLSSFWVMFAILVGGGLFGFAGMLLGVPTFAVLYAFINRYLERRLERKKLSKYTMDYHDLNRINEQTGEREYGVEKVTEVPVRHSSEEKGGEEK